MASVDDLISQHLVPDATVARPENWPYKVLLFVADQGSNGATDLEIAEALNAPGEASNLRPRRVELVEKQLLVDSGTKRETKSKKQATVWVLGTSVRDALTPHITSSDCDLAGQLSAGTVMSPVDRATAERLRARFALLGRRAIRAAAESKLALAVDVNGPGAIALTVWPDGRNRDRYNVTAELGAEGLKLLLHVGPSDADDERTQRFRAELSAASGDARTRIQHLVADGWSGDIDGVSVDSTDTWLQELGDQPLAAGALRRTITVAELEQLAAGVVDPFLQLVNAAMLAEASAEAALRDPIQTLVTNLFWTEERARALVALANRSRQLLFAGPPGTGKTLVARTLALALADEARVRLVQFHPTYAYEDFVEGIRPVIAAPPDDAVDEGEQDTASTAASALHYEVRPGVFRQLVDQARKSTDDVRHFMIVDEINRANLPRVLGELLFALEYRGPDNAVELPYSGGTFFIPDNVWVIGTMNTADRSVALMDAAMRRRFKEVRFDVDTNALKLWHARHTSAELGTEAAARLERLNGELADLLDEDRMIGHSFLMRRDLADIGFATVWTEDFEPVLRDHLLGRTDDLPALKEAFLGAL
ncbi:MAG: McrB family protein [Sporichthyaceae bacterium]